MKKNRFKKCAFIVIGVYCLLNFKPAAKGDILNLKNGRSIEGLIKKEDARNIDLEISFGSMKFSKRQIESIERSTPEEAALIRQGWDKERMKAQERAKETAERKEHEPKQVTVDKKSGHVVVVTTLNKKVKANLILDTGASLILLSNKVASALGPGISSSSGRFVELKMADGRKVIAKMVILDSVSVEGSEIQKVAAAILPVEDSDTLPQDGLLGMSFLKNFNFKIDQKYDKLILEKL